MARLIGELESKKPSHTTTILNLQMIQAQVEAMPYPMLEFVARQKRLPTEEERQQLLTAGDGGKADEPSEKG